MAHHEEDTSNLSPQERLFSEYMASGKSFSNIEIYRLAVEAYENALALNIHNEEAQLQINFCKKQLRFEKKVFSILAVCVVIIIGVVCLVRC